MNIEFWVKIGLGIWILIIIFNVFKDRYWNSESLEDDDTWG